jgi:spoIIIJ-associated protein
MAERDLDRYLEGIGIDVDGDDTHDRLIDDAAEDATATPPEEDAERSAQRLTDRAVAPPQTAPSDDDDIDFEQAMAGMGVGGIVPDDLSVDERAESFLVQLLLYLDPTYAVDVGFDDEGGVDVDIHGGDPGRLIGKGGRTLAALEFLTNAVVNKAEGDAPVRVSVDVGGYKRRRDERLRQTAQRAAARARKSGMPVELDPMSAAERRVVHVELADDPGVTSESTGEGRDRRVVIYPAEAA